MDEKSVRDVGVQANLCLADIEEEDDGVTLLGRQGLTLRIGGEEGLYQEVAEEGAKEGGEYSQLGPPLPPRTEHKRKDLCTYLGLPPGGHSQGRKDIINFLGMAQNLEQDMRSDKSKEISRFWELAQNVVWLSNRKDSDRRRMRRSLVGMLHSFITRTESEARLGNQNGRGEEEEEKMHFPHKLSASSHETRIAKVSSTFRDGWEEDPVAGSSLASYPIHNLNRNSVTASLSQASLSSNSFSSSSTASSISSLSSACARPATSSPEEPIYMDMARTKPPSTNFAKTACPRRARITETSSNDYIDMSNMSKVLNLFHE